MNLYNCTVSVSLLSSTSTENICRPWQRCWFLSHLKRLIPWLCFMEYESYDPQSISIWWIRMVHMRWYFSSTFISISICSILEFYSKNFYSFQQMGRVAISGEDVVVVSSNFSPMASFSSIWSRFSSHFIL